MKRGLAGTLAVLALSAPAAAPGYVRSRTTHGTPTRWLANCASVQPDLAGSPDLDPATTFSTLKDALTTWREATKGCAYLELDYVEPAPVEAHFDGANVVKFRTDRWCHPDDEQSQNVCYSSVAAGITTVFYVDRPGDSDDGVILDADVELNNLDFTFDFVDRVGGPTKSARPGTTIADFENTIVHELGHLQGLDHTCKDSATPANEVDENGKTPPSCSGLMGLPLTEFMKITEATMFNSAAPAETKKRTPESDDVAGICAAYPTAQRPDRCVAADISSYRKSGCSIAGRSPFLGPLLLLILAATFRRRRAR